MANCFIHFFVFHFSFVYELNGIYLFFRLFVCSKSRTRTFFGSSSIRNRSIFAHAIHMMTKSIDHPSFAWPHTHTANLENCLIACTLLWIWFFSPHTFAKNWPLLHVMHSQRSFSINKLSSLGRTVPPTKHNKCTQLSAKWANERAHTYRGLIMIKALSELNGGKITKEKNNQSVCVLCCWCCYYC